MKLNDLLTGLRSLANARSAPYQEIDAITALTQWLKALKIQTETDKYGNILCRVRKGMPRRTVAFVTHLDRPALRVKSVKGPAVETIAEGPIPLTGFKSAKLIFPKTKEGEIKASVTSSKGDKHQTQKATLKVAAKGPLPETGDFATFEGESFSRKENKLKGMSLSSATRVASIVATLHDLAEGSLPVDAFAIFTRAGFADSGGAVAVAVDFHLPRDTILFSIEAMPEGELKRGAGPVVLMGDASGPCDPRATAVMLGAAAEIKGKKFAYQRGAVLKSHLTPSIFLAFGLSAGGVALPTQNHLCFGARGVAPEEQDLRDVQNLVELCCGAAVRASAGGDDLDQRRNEFILSSTEGREKLKEPIDPVTGYPTGARF